MIGNEPLYKWICLRILPGCYDHDHHNVFGADIMTLQSPEYWKNRLSNMIEFYNLCKPLQEALSVFPEDYIDMRIELTKTMNQTQLNMLWIRQEIETREEMKDFPGAINGGY